MSLPAVAIVGRPNVGKSALLNTLARRRISIVDPTAGVTRDRIGAIIEHEDRYFELIDTGGYGIEDHDNLTEHVESQIRYAIAGASLILFVVDLVEEITPLDQEVARLLRTVDRPVVLVANKADTDVQEHRAGVLFALGFGEPICVSALHARNRRALLDRILHDLKDAAAHDAPEPILKLALVGRRNVGKSTFINTLAGSDRVIVSEVPGTTRDSVDVRFERNGRVFLAIDTAGLKKPRKHAGGIEHHSHTRALASIRRAEVVLFLLDSTAPISEVDKKLAGYIVGEYKPCILVVNKWDLAKGRAGAEDYRAYLDKTLPHLAHAPVAFTTATQARNIQSTLDVAEALFNQASLRVTTGQLNRAIEEVLAAQQPLADRHGSRPKLYYATQVSIRPPTILLFVNNPAIVREQYQRFVERRLRDALPFVEVPLRLVWRPRKSMPQAARHSREQAATRSRRPRRRGASETLGRAD